MLTIDMDKIRELLKKTHKKEENWRKVGRWVGCNFTTLNKIINHKRWTLRDSALLKLLVILAGIRRN